MKITRISLQLSGINLASLKEDEIMAHILEECSGLGIDPETMGDVNVYINIEGTAVTAYYACEHCSGSLRLN